ncbi:MAG: helix-turn-helix transcriptional regulator [Agathobacter sp.]|nr:helix-turn-helix transcriptional regulator [Agathobacter sp.]
MDYSVNTGNEQVLIERNSKHITDDIVDQLVAYRKKMKMTQQDIADATGIKRANVTRIELKKNEASLDSLVRIAGSMGLKLNITLEEIQP